MKILFLFLLMVISTAVFAQDKNNEVGIFWRFVPTPEGMEGIEMSSKGIMLTYGRKIPLGTKWTFKPTVGISGGVANITTYDIPSSNEIKIIVRGEDDNSLERATVDEIPKDEGGGPVTFSGGALVELLIQMLNQ
jgi:hypothetical protein